MDTIFITDIGSNSVRLAKIRGGKTEYKLTAVTRLSQGLSESGVICPEAAERTLLQIEKFAAAAKKEKGRLYLFATEAVRRAANGKAFALRVQSACGAPVDILSGEQEALAGYYGAGGPGENGVTVVDIGGASTEIVCGFKRDIKYAESIKTGTVELYENCGKDRDRLERFISDKLGGRKFDLCNKCVAIGGTAGSLAAVDLGLKEYDADKTHGHYISAGRLKEIAARLLNMAREDITKAYCIDEKRADVIGGGALLLCGIVKRTGCGGVYISENDNIEGYAVIKGLIHPVA